MNTQVIAHEDRSTIETKVAEALKTGNYNVRNVGLFAPVELDVFIVPNGSYRCGDNEIYADDIIEQNKAFGVNVTKDDEVIQVWITPRSEALKKENDNWTDHGYPVMFKDHFGSTYAPSNLPFSFLNGRKEGEVVDMISQNGYRFKLRFKQRGYRYTDHGNFEDVVAHLHGLHLARKAAI